VPDVADILVPAVAIGLIVLGGLMLQRLARRHGTLQAALRLTYRQVAAGYALILLGVTLAVGYWAIFHMARDFPSLPLAAVVFLAGFLVLVLRNRRAPP
jgi:cytochrome bd-type quinol oxidase subunit 2